MHGHRGTKRRWVYELSKGSRHINEFLTKKTAERLGNEEFNRRKAKNKLKKSWNMCQFWNAFSGSEKHFGINFRRLHFNIASNKNQFYKKQNYRQKTGPLIRKKRLKMVINMCIQSKTTFQIQKSFTKRQRMIKKTSLAQKKLAHTATILTFAFRSK